jgi:hypothetical protein
MPGRLHRNPQWAALCEIATGEELTAYFELPYRIDHDCDDAVFALRDAFWAKVQTCGCRQMQMQ